jgi:hypothetical protein
LASVKDEPSVAIAPEASVVVPTPRSVPPDQARAPVTLEHPDDSRSTPIDRTSLVTVRVP